MRVVSSFIIPTGPVPVLSSCPSYVNDPLGAATQVIDLVTWFSTFEACCSFTQSWAGQKRGSRWGRMREPDYKQNSGKYMIHDITSLLDMASMTMSLMGLAVL